MHKILIIEDDAAISNLIKSALTREGYSCEIASDGLIGEQMFDSGSWDLVLLDLMLPGTSGFELIEYIKPSKTPVIVISAMNQTGDKIRGLKMGADDYIGKPFQIGELLARVEALLRRTSHTENIFNYLDIELLETFIRNKNIAISRSNLYEMVWNEPVMGDTRTIDNHVSSLRKKLGYDGLIQTVHGIGYRMDVIS